MIMTTLESRAANKPRRSVEQLDLLCRRVCWRLQVDNCIRLLQWRDSSCGGPKSWLDSDTSGLVGRPSRDLWLALQVASHLTRSQATASSNGLGAAPKPLIEGSLLWPVDKHRESRVASSYGCRASFAQRIRSPATRVATGEPRNKQTNKRKPHRKRSELAKLAASLAQQSTARLGSAQLEQSSELFCGLGAQSRRAEMIMNRVAR